MPGPKGEACLVCYWGDYCASRIDGKEVQCHHTSALMNREWEMFEDVVARSHLWYCENFLNREKHLKALKQFKRVTDQMEAAVTAMVDDDESN